ncbi:MAG: hypothetical protein K2N16_04085 [Muribaculaceae bacterium]|nr:hypothetical protein [Muribaculaceae bacterium]
MATNHGYNNRKRRKRKPRWGRIIVALMILVGGIWLAARGIVSCLSEPPAMAISEDAGERTHEPCVPTLEAVLAEEANPWESHLEAMPDDGCVKLKINPIGGSLAKVFDDLNPLHLEAARALGVDAINSDGDAWRLRRPIVEIKSCREYFVDDLRHSYPFLVPEAAQLLADIGSAFNAELAARGGGAYRIKVTSVMRTPRTVGQLRKVNRNATSESAHQYATTFDISYGKFICDDDTQPRRTQEDLKNLLAEVLHRLRAQGRCYVKYEYKQACFHITARP